MAKIVSQISFADYCSELEPLGDLERLQLAIEGMDDEGLMLQLESNRGNGRDDYPIRVMWNLLLAGKIFEHRTTASLRRELERNSQLRRMCGLEDLRRKQHLVPPARVFTGFYKLLTDEQTSIDEMFTGTVEELCEWLPEFGENTAGDGKYLDSYSKHPAREVNPNAGDRAEHDAKWSIKEYHYVDKKGEKKVKKEYHYGLKANIICDVKTELPIAYNVLAANCDEKAAMTDLIKDMPDALKARIHTLALDKGYDAASMIQTVKGAGIIPIVDIRNCWKARNPEVSVLAK